MRRTLLAMLTIVVLSAFNVGLVISGITYASVDFEDFRIALMQSYNAQSITHVGYVIALGVALATLFSKWNDIWNFSYGVWKRWLLLLAILSLIFSFMTYFSLRIIFYSTLSAGVLSITELDISDVEGKTVILRMQNALIARLQNRSLSLVDPLYYARAFYNLEFIPSMLVLSGSYFLLMFVGYFAVKEIEEKLRTILCRRQRRD